MRLWPLSQVARLPSFARHQRPPMAGPVQPVALPPCQTDVDECVTVNGGCSPYATCNNTVGSRECTCKDGYTGDGITCTGTGIAAREEGVQTSLHVHHTPALLSYSPLPPPPTSRHRRVQHAAKRRLPRAVELHQHAWRLQLHLPSGLRLERDCLHG